MTFFFIAFILLFGGVFILKLVLMLIALIFGSIGFIIKMILIIFMALLLFPLTFLLLGSLFTGGILGLVFLLAGISLIRN